VKFGRIQTQPRNVDDGGGDQYTVEVTVEQGIVWLHACAWDLVDQGVTVPLDAAQARKLLEMLAKATAWAGAE
jgi:hypothetical protein